MSRLHLQRCRTHPAREAAARCPICRRFFCRECVAEHGGRLLCAECLAQAAGAAPDGRRGRVWMQAPLQWAAGLLVAWLSWQTLGQVLAELPDDFHEGTFWRSVAAPLSGEGP